LIALGCGIGCDGGPISDFPHVGGPAKPPPAGNDGTPGGGSAGGATGGPGGSQVHEPPGPGGATGGGVDPGAPGALGGVETGGLVGGGTTGGASIGGTAGGGPVGAADAGVALDAGAPIDAGNAGDSAAADGEVGQEAGPDPVDAAPNDGGIEAGGADGGECQPDSRARVGGCQGSYCAITRDGLDHLVSSGVCSAPAALALVCEGEIAHKTAQCAQDNALSLALGASVRSCLRRDLQLMPVDGGCLDCYVEELLCTLSSCLATCVAGFETACTSCRRANCGAKFTRCSGLPAL
jgi:hypothetical protein